jgi:hypothetical protein
MECQIAVVILAWPKEKKRKNKKKKKKDMPLLNDMGCNSFK